MKSDIISEAIKKIDTDLVRDAAAYGSGAGAEQAKQTHTAAAGKRWKKAVAVAATVFLLVGGITAGIILVIRKPGGSTSGIPGTQPDPVPGASASLTHFMLPAMLSRNPSFSPAWTLITNPGFLCAMRTSSWITGAISLISFNSSPIISLPATYGSAATACSVSKFSLK